MHFGKRTFNSKYIMQDSNGNFHALQETTEEKDLGIWTVHIVYAVKKAN